MSGTELAWDRALVLQPGRETTVRVDFLVLNCLAATTSSAPAEVRMVVRARRRRRDGARAEVPTEDQAALINASGEAICAQDSARAATSAARSSADPYAPDGLRTALETTRR